MRLRRHDYTAEVVGRWARVDGMLFPTRRWVRPIGPGNRPLALPTVVWLQLSEIEVR